MRGELYFGTSMDQVIASQVGMQTAIPSLVLGIEPNELRLEDGLSMIYGSSVSWVSSGAWSTDLHYRVERLRNLIEASCLACSGRGARPFQ